MFFSSESEFKKFFKIIYSAALGLSRGTWDLLLQHAGSSLLHSGFSLVEACGLSSCGARALERMGLVSPQHVGILVPRPGIEPVSPALEGGFLTTGLRGKSLKVNFILFFNKFIYLFLFLAALGLCCCVQTFL